MTVEVTEHTDDYVPARETVADALQAENLQLRDILNRLLPNREAEILIRKVIGSSVKNYSFIRCNNEAGELIFDLSETLLIEARAILQDAQT